MAGVIESITHFFGGKPANDRAAQVEQIAAYRAALEAEAIRRLDEQARIAAAEKAAVANDNAVSETTAPQEAPVVNLVSEPDTIFAKRLNTHRVDRLGYKEDAAHPSYIMAVESAHFGPADPNHSPRIRFGGVEQSVKLTIKMKEEVGNYDTDSLSNAIHAELARIPVLHGKLHFEQDAKDQGFNKEDIGNKVKKLIKASGKISATKQEQIAQYFDRDPNTSVNYGEYGGINVDHPDGMVNVRLDVGELKSDKDSDTLGEQELIKYLDTAKPAIVKAMREALKAHFAQPHDGKHAPAMKPEDIDALDFDAVITKKEGDWRALPHLTFGTRKPDGTLDKTGLAEMKSELVTKIFTDAFLKSSPDLPPGFARFATGPMVAQVLREELGDTPELKHLLDHELFKTSEARKAEHKDREEKHQVTIGNATESADPNEQRTLSLQFDLPHGVTLTSLRASIIDQHKAESASKHLTALTAKRQEAAVQVPGSMAL